MKIVWQIDLKDVNRVRSFLELHQDDPFVQYRIERNLREPKPEVSKELFWKVLVACLLTSQQRSGPGTPVTRFISTDPFPLNYQLCKTQQDLRSYARDRLEAHGGIRFVNRLPDQFADNLEHLQAGLWEETLPVLEELRLSQAAECERKAASFLDSKFKGLGPKQSRNLLQSLGLSRYEIPIDSRITKWLNDFGFPIRLSAGALSDPNYYSFVSDGLQQLCTACGVYPCILDAAIFASFDRGGWTEDNVVW